MTEDATQRTLYQKLALTLFHEYLHGVGEPGKPGYQEPSGWAEERATAWGCIAEIAILSLHPEVAIQAYQSAIDEAPQFPNFYVDMALAYVMLEDYKKAKHWLDVATTIPMPNTTIIMLPRELKTRALEASFQINLHNQKLELAKEDAEKLCEILPDDQRAKDRLLSITSLHAFNKACQSVVFLGKYLEQLKESDKIQYLIQSLPNDMQQEKFVSEMRHRFLPQKIWGEKEITILCGPGVGQWSPKSIATGLGGSEEAVVYLSQELTKLGWHVTVYANPQAEAGDYDGVEYKQWYDLNPKDMFNVLILWRAIGFVDINPQARFTMLWAHDVPVCPDLTEERIAKVDKIAVLSQYHKSLFRMMKADGSFTAIPEEKFFLTGNGIPALPEKGQQRNPKRMIYCSSLDRGLIYLLNNWEKVRKEVPDAELHIYYGFQTFDVLRKGNPAAMQWKENILKLMKQPGIIYLGRVGHEELHQEFLKSGIWAYPTDFCVSGDTLVDMPRDYTQHPMGVKICDLVGRKNFLVWTFNEQNGNFELKRALWVKKTRESAPMLRVHWTDGTHLECTPDHKVLTYTRGWVMAKDLAEGESAVALKKHMQVEVSVGKGPWKKEHRIIAENMLGPIPQGYHVDHLDGNPWNNTPENIQYLSAEDHAKKTFTGLQHTLHARRKQGEGFRRWCASDVGKKKLSENGHARAKKFWDSMTEDQRKQFVEHRNALRTEKKKVFWNHKVLSVEEIAPQDAYDMLVEDNHNFIAGGVVIHNCEIHCISAAKAQALGAVPVTTNYAALKETVRNGVKVDADITTPEGQEEYVKALVDMLQHPKKQEELRPGMMRWAREYFPWALVAKHWNTLLTDWITHPEKKFLVPETKEEHAV